MVVAVPGVIDRRFASLPSAAVLLSSLNWSLYIALT